DLRHLGEAHDRVIGPRPGGHARLVEAHRFHQRPARGLDDAALDLVDDAVGIDDLARVDRGDDAADAHPAALAIDLDVRDQRAVAGKVLVPGEGEPTPARAVAAASRLPVGAPSGRLDHRARPRGAGECLMFLSRRPTGAAPAAAASSSTNDSSAKTLAYAPSVRSAEVRSALSAM